MDVAYDHIQEETLSSDTPNDPSDPSSSRPPQASLNTEFQETFRAFSASPWGARLNGFLGNVRKQGESYYEGARQEYTAASEEALKGFTDLKESIVNRTRGLSLGGGDQQPLQQSQADGSGQGEEGESKTTSEGKARTGSDETLKVHQPHDDGLLSRFRSEATKRLKDIKAAEDAADEALLRFGTNISNFLRDAVSIAPPDDQDASDSGRNGGVLFESKDSEGKRVIHTTRFDAQLHVIHSSLDSFMKDPVSVEWPEFKKNFKVNDKTDDIGKNLEKYSELRRAMERLVPEKVEYGDFWCRYYFLRLVIETEEQKRRELLKGASAEADEEVAWDEDSDTEETPSTNTPQVSAINVVSSSSSSTATSVTAKPTSQQPTSSPQQRQQQSASTDSPSLKEPRKSNDQHSQPDSDASYDLVSGATSRAPGSPKEETAAPPKPQQSVKEESDEEDWE